MNSVAIFCVFTIVIASVHGGSQRVGRQGGKGLGLGGIFINTAGGSQAIGVGSGVAEHDATISISGSPQLPTLFNLASGSQGGLSQGVSNYQQTQVNSDGASAVYQGNYASNDGFANEYLSGDAQGSSVNVESNGWSAVEGGGEIGQADSTQHTSGSNSGTTSQ